MQALVTELKLGGKTVLIRCLEKLAAAAVDVARPKAAARLSALKALDAGHMRMDHDLGEVFEGTVSAVTR